VKLAEELAVKLSEELAVKLAVKLEVEPQGETDTQNCAWSLPTQLLVVEIWKT